VRNSFFCMVLEESSVALAVALAVRGPRLGHVYVDLETVRDTATVDAEEGVDVAALPWPEPRAWIERLAASPLVATGEGTPPRRATPRRPSRRAPTTTPGALSAAIPNEHRAQVMSAFYIVAYASLSLPAVLAGIVVRPLGLQPDVRDLRQRRRGDRGDRGNSGRADAPAAGARPARTGLSADGVCRPGCPP
jgi:hypothetical protein